MSALAPSDLFAGKTAVVTGASAGIGEGFARYAAGLGMKLVLADIAADRLESVAAQLRANGAEVEAVVTDVSDPQSVEAMASQAVGRFGQVDMVINNAGIMVPPLGYTNDGFESQFGTNHLGHFALTNLLLPQIRSRVVTVSSLAHKQGSIDFSDLNWQRRRYRAMAAYAQSKLANMLFTTELDRRLAEAGSEVIATAAHPGLAATNLFRSAEGSPLRRGLSKAFTTLVAQKDRAGAAPTLNAAVADVPGNSYLGPGRMFETRGQPVFASRTPASLDGDVARRLWEASAELTGIGFPESLS